MIKTSYAIFVSVTAMIVLTWYFNNILNENYTKQEVLQERVWQLEDDCGYVEANKIAFNVTVTTYNPTPSQTDSTPNITADGTVINPWKASEYRYIALSRDLLTRWGGPLDYGDWVVIEGTGKYDGVYQVRDTMNPKFTKRVDILRSRGARKFKYNQVTLTKYGSEMEAKIANNS